VTDIGGKERTNVTSERSGKKEPRYINTYKKGYGGTKYISKIRGGKRNHTAPALGRPGPPSKGSARVSGGAGVLCRSGPGMGGENEMGNLAK
jgi:hypothetical protein